MHVVRINSSALGLLATCERTGFAAAWRSAIGSRVLVSVDRHSACYTGWQVPVAVSATAWNDAVTWLPAAVARHPLAEHDSAERLIRLLMHAKDAAAAAAVGCRRACFRMLRIKRDGPRNLLSPCEFVVRLDSDAWCQPYITILLDGEDQAHA